MKRSKTGATGPRGAKGVRGVAGQRGTTGKAGQRGIRGLRGLTGTIHKAEMLDRLVAHFEDIYQQLTAQAKLIADLQQQLAKISPDLKHRS